SIAGSTWDDPAVCQPAAPMHLLEVHGTSDTNVPYAGDTFNVGGKSVHFPGAEETVRRWAVYNGCSVDAFTKENADVIARLAGAETEITRYESGCAAGGSAELWKIVNGDHGIATSAPEFTERLIDWLFAHPKRAYPTASFTLTPGEGTAPLDVTLDASMSLPPPDGALGKYLWTFEDGSSAEGITVHRTFGPGRFLPRLVVATDDDRRSLPATRTVNAYCPSDDVSPWKQLEVGQAQFPGAARLQASQSRPELLPCTR